MGSINNIECSMNIEKHEI